MKEAVKKKEEKNYPMGMKKPDFNAEKIFTVIGCHLLWRRQVNDHRREPLGSLL